MALPKYNYNENEFYEELFGFALQGYNDAEIADAMSLDDKVFYAMKNGKYNNWNEEQNRERSARIRDVLARARRKINSIVRGRYLKSALGGIKTISKGRRFAEVKCDCKGEDMDCPHCHGVGVIVSKVKAIVSETEVELPPNVQALSTWLFHHDPEWRRIQRGLDEQEEETTDKGVKVEKWLEQEMREEQTTDDTNSVNL